MKNRHVTQHTQTTPHHYYPASAEDSLRLPCLFCFMMEKTEIQPSFNRTESEGTWMRKLCKVLCHSDQVLMNNALVISAVTFIRIKSRTVKQGERIH